MKLCATKTIKMYSRKTNGGGTKTCGNNMQQQQQQKISFYLTIWAYPARCKTSVCATHPCNTGICMWWSNRKIMLSATGKVVVEKKYTKICFYSRAYCLLIKNACAKRNEVDATGFHGVTNSMFCLNIQFDSYVCARIIYRFKLHCSFVMNVLAPL